MASQVPLLLTLLPLATFVAGVITRPISAAITRHFSQKDEAAKRNLAREDAERERVQALADAERERTNRDEADRIARQRMNGEKFAQEVFSAIEAVVQARRPSPPSIQVSHDTAPVLSDLIGGTLTRIPSPQVRRDLQDGLDIYGTASTAVGLGLTDESAAFIQHDALRDMRTVVAAYLNEEEPDDDLSRKLRTGGEVAKEAWEEQDRLSQRQG